MASTPWNKRIRLHESTQRELCRLVFVCLGLIPILWIASYSVIRFTPWYQSYQKRCWEQRISDNLGGLNVRMGSIEFPSPHHFRARDLVCANPETGQDILKVPNVQVTMVGNGWIVDLDAPELNGKEMQCAVQVIHDWFLCRPQKTATKLAMTFPELLVHDGQRTTAFQNVGIAVEPSEKTSILSFKFAFANQKFAVPAALILTRYHALEYPTTRWELNTNDITLPCSLLSERFPLLRTLGERATFQGKIAWTQSEHHWNAQLENGRFSATDLGTSTSAIGGPVRGLASLTVKQALIRNGTIHNIQGSLDLIPNQTATVDTAWLKDTISLLNLIPSPQLRDYQAKTTDIQNLSVDFQLNDRGLVIQGKNNYGYPQLIAACFSDRMMLAGNETKPADLEDVARWLNPNPQFNRSWTSLLSGALPWASSSPTKVAARPQ